MPIHLPPPLPIPTLTRGDLVRMVGHVNDPAAEACRVIPTGELEVTEADRRRWRCSRRSSSAEAHS